MLSYTRNDDGSWNVVHPDGGTIAVIPASHVVAGRAAHPTASINEILYALYHGQSWREYL